MYLEKIVYVHNKIIFIQKKKKKKQRGNKKIIDQSEILVDYERERTMKGW